MKPALNRSVSRLVSSTAAACLLGLMAPIATHAQDKIGRAHV